MKNFLNKEIRLNLAPVNYLFMAFASMIIIPNYPCYVPFFYFALSVFFIFNNAELNRDIQYSMVLPITKKEIVKSRCILVFFYEIFFMVMTVFTFKKYASKSSTRVAYFVFVIQSVFTICFELISYHFQWF